MTGKNSLKSGLTQQMNKKVYRAVMARADGKCEMCGSWNGERLQLHHVFGGNGKRRQTESEITCVALCPECHRQVHSNRKKDLQLKIKSQDKYRKQGYSDDEIRKLVGGKLYF